MERATYWNIESTRAGVDDEKKGTFQERNKKLLETHNHDIYTCDRYWQKLQKDNKIFSM